MEFIPDILNILSTVGIVNGLRLPAVAIIASSAGQSHLWPSGLALHIAEMQAPVISSFSGPYPSGAYDFYQVLCRPSFPERHNSNPCKARHPSFASEN